MFRVPGEPFGVTWIKIYVEHHYGSLDDPTISGSSPQYCVRYVSAATARDAATALANHFAPPGKSTCVEAFVSRDGISAGEFRFEPGPWIVREE